MRAAMLAIVVAALVFTGCQQTPKAPEEGGASTPDVKAAIPSAGFDRGPYVTLLHEERVWVFPKGSDDLASFLAGNEPAKNVTMVKAGPGGYTLRSTSNETLQGFLAFKEGFETFIVDGRIWVFRPGSEDLAQFHKTGEPAKNVTKVRAGPGGMTVKGGDLDTVNQYLTAKPGFVTFIDDGRLWVFVPGSEDLAEYEKAGEPAKSVTRVRAGPGGMTIRAPDGTIIDSYLAAADGFETFIVDGRIWVFRPGSEDLEEYQRVGEPAKNVTKVRAGPGGMTVKSGDMGTITDYLRMVSAH
jgi:hypothetical protein